MQAVLGPCLAEIGLYGNVSAYMLTIRSPWLVKRAYLLKSQFSFPSADLLPNEIKTDDQERDALEEKKVEVDSLCRQQASCGGSQQQESK